VETPRDLAVLICPLPLSLLDALDEHAQVEGIDRAAAVRALLTEALDVHRIARAVDELAALSANDNIIPFPARFLDEEPS